MHASRPLLIDCDPGIDDAMALLLALASPEYQVMGIGTCFGNASIQQTTRNARGILELAGATGIPVAAGAATSLSGSSAQSVAHIHGHDGMADCNCLPSTEDSLSETASHAALQLIDLSIRYSGELVVLTLGPLSNIALALALDPRLPERVAHIVIMGGNATVAGNATPAAEANVLADPVAADRVLGERWHRCTLVGLDVTQRAILRSDSIDGLLSTNAVVSQLAVPLRHYWTFYRQTNGVDGICLHDPTAMAYLLKPDAFQTRAWPLRVQTSGMGLGKTWPSAGDADVASPVEWRGRPLVDVCVDLQVHDVVNEVERRLGSQAARSPAATSRTAA